ncbi:MAG: response regulator [Nostocaceae cyanobacterium]|nr:response regulator [Nostocaceae cyanobacterium]
MELPKIKDFANLSLDLCEFFESQCFLAVIIKEKKPKIILMNTVLVIEEGLTDREIISCCLQRVGYYVISAASSQDSLEKLDINLPKLIFIDAILYSKNSFDICHHLKNNPSTKQIPIVICSRKNSAIDKMRGMILGADAYIAKPLNQAEIIQTAQRLIEVYDNRTRN